MWISLYSDKLVFNIQKPLEEEELRVLMIINIIYRIVWQWIWYDFEYE